MGLAAVILATLQGAILLTTVTLSMLIGTIYSLPPIRLKRHPFWAATCIFGVRGIVVNLGFFLHFRRLFHPAAAAAGPLLENPGWLGEIPAEIWALSGFVILFSIGIALLKDVPDLEGDRQHQIRTLTVRLGPEAVMRRSRRLLAGCYLLMVGLTLAGLLPNVRPTLLIVSQLAILAMMWWRSRRTDPGDRAAVSRFYQFIWRLFFLQYLLVPLACLPRS
jgi:homogentisate phytyltransferase/homogentisate geranylgeranyltransferase